MGGNTAIWIAAALRDLRYSLRPLGADWRFTAGAILILALGIGANTAMFGIINSALLRDPGFDEADPG